jgi:hypothetical protein
VGGAAGADDVRVRSLRPRDISVINSLPFLPPC